MAKANTNKMRWNCDTHGCFNKQHRLQFGMLEDALPGNLGFTDVDALTEYCGNGLLIEWKEPGATLPTGQRITYANLTRGRMLTGFFVTGDACRMEPQQLVQIIDGNFSPPADVDLTRLKQAISNWSEWSRNNSRLGG